MQVVDSPGFGDSDLEDDELIEEMLDVLKNTIKHSSTILLVLKGTETRFNAALLDMLTKMSSIFGKRWWQYMVIGKIHLHNQHNFPDQTLYF